MTEPMRLSKIFLRRGAIQGGGGPNEAKEASLSDEGGGRGGEGRGGECVLVPCAEQSFTKSQRPNARNSAVSKFRS